MIMVKYYSEREANQRKWHGENGMAEFYQRQIVFYSAEK